MWGGKTALWSCVYKIFVLANILSIYEVHTISFQTFFVWAFKTIVDSWKFSILLLYIIYMRWLTNFHDFSLKWTATAATGIHPTKAWWISKMPPGRKDTLEAGYAIKLCFKLGKNATETYAMLQTTIEASCINRASVFEWHKRFKDGRVSVRDDERCGRSKEVNTPELIGQRFRVRVIMLRF